MPSDTAIVVNSTGVPPAARTPRLTSSASVRRCRLHGITSVCVPTTATSGRSRSASVSPVALSIARAGARLGPFFSGSLLMVASCSVGKQKAPLPREGCGAVCVNLVSSGWQPAPGANQHQTNGQAEPEGGTYYYERRYQHLRGRRRDANRHLLEQLVRKALHRTERLRAMPQRVKLF